MNLSRFVFLCLMLPAAFAQAPAPSPEGLLRDASAAFQSGDMPTAIQLYRAFLKECSDAAEIRSNLGAALVGNSQLEEAIAEYKKALEELPNNPRVRMNLALAYYKIGQLPAAMKELETLRAAQPLDLKPTLLLADCLMLTDQPQKAVDLLTPLSAEFPEDHAVIYLLGMSQLKLKHTPEAQALLDRILREGQSAESEYLLGQGEYLRQNMMAAADHLKRAIELNPKLPRAHSLYGQILRGSGKLDEANEQFRLELEVNPFDFQANAETAARLKQEGQYDEALRSCARALQVRPTDPGALFQRASIHVMQGHLEQARQELEPLVKDYPSFYEAHATLATVYYRLQRTADGNRERDAARKAQFDAQQTGQPAAAPVKK